LLGRSRSDEARSACAADSDSGRDVTRDDGRATALQAVARHDPRTWASYVRDAATYVPRRYDGDVCLLTQTGARGWDHATRRAHVIEIAGDHEAWINDARRDPRAHHRPCVAPLRLGEPSPRSADAEPLLIS
jgi:hypothetical protein